MKFLNRNTPDKWKKDIASSVDFYNQWFLQFAPKTFRETRIQTTKEVEIALKKTENLLDLNPKVLSENPNILAMLRMSTCPPIARDRLIGLSYVTPSLVKSLESNKLPIRMDNGTLVKELTKLCDTIQKLIDPDIFTWIEKKKTPTDTEVKRASTIVADRLCGAVADPIVRNAQEKRQLSLISKWLGERNYRKLESNETEDFREFPKGTYAFHYNVRVNLNKEKSVNIPVDIIINPHKNTSANIPILVEAKSAGDFTNVNKRRKEEAVKMSQLKNTYGNKIQFILFLCGYFDSGYLGYEAAEGIDWIWEHRIDDFSKLGL
ncbi:MAG: XamI family restriction endonuclease [Bacteroidales bacterium]|nr:XamI family restriction endonuclease [Bacteroidales bacterium]MCF8458579.1 XamI family restriction endonuclease [Bacteroidales bacterium]